MKKLQFKTLSMWGGAERVESKKSKLIPALPHGVGLKSCPTTFARWGKLAWGEAERTGLAGLGKIAIPSTHSMYYFFFFRFYKYLARLEDFGPCWKLL